MTKTPRIDLERLLGRLDAFNHIGALPGGGNCRLALTDEDRAGRDLLAQVVLQLGHVHRVASYAAHLCDKLGMSVDERETIIKGDGRITFVAACLRGSKRIRFANASSQSDREKDVRGMSIRISGVAGENLTPGESRQDFVLNSHPVMVAANTKDFMELLQGPRGCESSPSGSHLRTTGGDTLPAAAAWRTEDT